MLDIAFLIIVFIAIYVGIIYRIGRNIQTKYIDTVTYKGRLYVRGRKIGRTVQLLDFTSSRGLKSFFVNEDELDSWKLVKEALWPY